MISKNIRKKVPLSPPLILILSEECDIVCYLVLLVGCVGDRVEWCSCQSLGRRLIKINNVLLGRLQLLRLP